jgi:2-polyprenyl-3-methyl-5-hydroxy-6-metoxy-1,4-benzoquinol methylase
MNSTGGRGRTCGLSVREVLRRYGAESWGSRLFLAVRWMWTPYAEVARSLPVKGRILDAGCGHGLLALELSLRSPERRILGVDHDVPRIRAAQKASRDLKNVEFRDGDFTKVPQGLFDGIMYMDDLHYLPYADQETLLRRSRKALRRGGVLVFREVAQTGSFFSGWNRLHEKIMTAVGLTKAEKLHFRTPEGWKTLAESVGFQVHVRPLSRPPFADVLFECRPR